MPSGAASLGSPVSPTRWDVCRLNSRGVLGGEGGASLSLFWRVSASSRTVAESRPRVSSAKRSWLPTLLLMISMARLVSWLSIRRSGLWAEQPEMRRPCLAVSTMVMTLRPASRASCTVMLADVDDPEGRRFRLAYQEDSMRCKLGYCCIPPHTATQSPGTALSSSVIPCKHSALTSSGMLSGSTERTSCSKSGPPSIDEKSTPMHIPSVIAAAENATPNPAAC